uniref:Uncharacterized protein n=1 Tax=Timema cristinae TaxID=61476 RepID=A0A7R9DEI5_TIMCR|nr:unnamed protein product [Timema cristinae]
MPMNRASWTWL